MDYLRVCKCCKRKQGSWKLTTYCKDKNDNNHVTKIQLRFQVKYCNDCQDHYRQAKSLSPKKRKRLEPEELPTFDKYKHEIPEYFMQNMPDKPNVLSLVKYLHGGERLYLKSKD
jgi:hypothetical protein